MGDYPLVDSYETQSYEDQAKLAPSGLGPLAPEWEGQATQVDLRPRK